MNDELKNKLDFLSSAENATAICGVVRGIERETLRVKTNGAIAKTEHPKVFGSALTHPYITTDYAESLMEFITPASTDANKTIAQLTDIHGYVAKNLGDEYLWPLSMPCYIAKEEDIQLANFGSSNSGKMKHLYREGLRYRYGSFMQVISGIHFNFSFPQSYWQAMAKYEGLADTSQDFQSDQYLRLIRNFKRYVWLLTYLYGASPALCGSFIGDRASKYPFQKVGKGSLYLPYATSLRLSDLGYTSNAQTQLNVSYSSLDEYVSGLRKAIKTPHHGYDIPADNPKGYAQLNNNLLQIENEYYSPIRPKRTTKPNEKPTDALAERGIEYVEVRSLDVNPFSPVGIDLSQIQFLDVFLTYCSLKSSPVFDDLENAQVQQNLNTVILQGRELGVKLARQDQQLSLAQWGGEIFDELQLVAQWFDNASDSTSYSDVVAQQRQALNDPQLTLSARFLNELTKDDIGSGVWGVARARENKAMLLQTQPNMFSDDMMAEQTELSLQKQQQIESADKVDFETFLKNYFAG